MVLLTSVCNDRYLPGLLVFLHSFKKHHPTWDHPFKIYHRDDLSENSKNKLNVNLNFGAFTDCGLIA